MAELFVVEIAGKKLAIATSQVRSIAAAGFVTPLPTAPPKVVGVTQIRGHILPVLELSEARAMQPVQPGDPLVVLEFGPARAALRVDRVVGEPALPTTIERLDVGALFDAVRVAHHE